MEQTQRGVGRLWVPPLHCTAQHPWSYGPLCPALALTLPSHLPPLQVDRLAYEALLKPFILAELSLAGQFRRRTSGQSVENEYFPDLSEDRLDVTVPAGGAMDVGLIMRTLPGYPARPSNKGQGLDACVADQTHHDS